MTGTGCRSVSRVTLEYGSGKRTEDSLANRI